MYCIRFKSNYVPNTFHNFTVTVILNGHEFRRRHSLVCEHEQVKLISGVHQVPDSWFKAYTCGNLPHERRSSNVRIRFYPCVLHPVAYEVQIHIIIRKRNSVFYYSWVRWSSDKLVRSNDVCELTWWWPGGPKDVVRGRWSNVKWK
jgi:hypothetical protein